MVSADRMLRWLCWVLIATVIVSAIMTLTLSLNPFATDIPDTTDFVERLLIFRGYDRDLYPLSVVSNLATLLVFFIAALLGAALRFVAPAGAVRDVMAVIFVVGGTLGVAAQLLNLAVNTAATFSYCDCGYRPYEVIAQDYALGIGWTMQQWLNLGAITIVGVGAAVAGWLIRISRDWMLISYLIALGLLVGVVLQIAGLGPTSSLVVGVVSGIGVPIWAFLLARGASQGPPRAAGA